MSDNTKADNIKTEVYEFFIVFIDDKTTVIYGTSVQENGSFVTFMEESGSATIVATSQIKTIRQSLSRA